MNHKKQNENEHEQRLWWLIKSFSLFFFSFFLSSFNLNLTLGIFFLFSWLSTFYFTIAKMLFWLLKLVSLEVEGRRWVSSVVSFCEKRKSLSEKSEQHGTVNKSDVDKKTISVDHDRESLFHIQWKWKNKWEKKMENFFCSFWWCKTVIICNR